MKEASHKGACIGSLCLVVVVVVLGRKWGENIKYEVFFFVVIKVFQKWLLWWLLICTFQIWSVAYCFKTTFLQQQWSSTFYFSSKRISSRQIPWWMDWTWIWYSVVSLKSRINMWSFALGHCERKPSQLYLAIFKGLETATRNCLNDFKHQYGIKRWRWSEEIV